MKNKKPVIIYVDDEKIVLDSIKDQLKRNFDRGIVFESAQSAEEALELLDELKEFGITVPLIISDHIMPNMKGDEFLIKVYERFPEIKTILLTGQADANAVGNAVNNAHLYRFISKPWVEKDLTQTVREAVKSFEDSNELEILYDKLEELTDVVDEEIRHNKELTQRTKEVEDRGLKLKREVEDSSLRLEVLHSAVIKLIRAKESAESAAKAKAQFLSTMSHELRTPLNAIIGISNLLSEDEPKPEQEENINALNFSSHTLLMLINDILDFSKIEAGKMTFEEVGVDPLQLSENIIKIHKGNTIIKGIDLTLNIEDNLPKIVADPTRLSQVLNNLLSNAIKFTSSGGVELCVKKQSESDEECTIYFHVKDSGIGIPKDKVDKIFESFTQADSNTTRNFGGTGLGLAITRKLIELQSGEIKVDSVLGEGSTFYFSISFPKHKEEVSDNNGNKESLIDFSNEPVLFVEDNEMNVLVASQFFDRWGLDITVAGNGEEALKELERGTYKLILMDCQMPIMDGFEATKKIRETDKEIPIVALTASAMKEDQEKIIDCGMNDYELKPFDPIRLNNKIARYLNYKISA